MAISREVGGGFDHRVFCRLIDAIGQIGLASRTLEKGFDAAVLNR